MTTQDSISLSLKWAAFEKEMNEDIKNTNQEVIEKIFDMMEKFTQRILLIEKKIWNGQS